MQQVVTIEKKTVQDYQQLPEGAPYQLINGKLIMSPSPNRTHQKLIGRIIMSKRRVHSKRLSLFD